MPIENRDIDSTSSDDDTKKAAGRAIAARFDAVVASDPALQAQIRGMIRADADEEDKKPEVPEEKVAEGEDGEGNKILSALDKIGDASSGLCQRVDALEAGGGTMTDEDEDMEEGDHARRVAADSRRKKEARSDSERYMSPKTRDAFAEAQARCDEFASAFGSQAVPAEN